jgi:Serine endopeptidase inhibitors
MLIMKKNKKNIPFFAKFLENQQAASEQGKSVGGTSVTEYEVVTLKYPSDWEDATKPVRDDVVTLKFPSDDDEFVTLKYPSDDDEVITLKYPSDNEDIAL